jgi:hypothetical protein
MPRMTSLWREVRGRWCSTFPHERPRGNQRSDGFAVQPNSVIRNSANRLDKLVGIALLQKDSAGSSFHDCKVAASVMPAVTIRIFTSCWQFLSSSPGLNPAPRQDRNPASTTSAGEVESAEMASAAVPH